MPPQARVNGSDSQASGRARQRLKLGAIGYVNARHGVDTDADLARGALMTLCQRAVEFVASLPGGNLKNRRVDLLSQGNRLQLQLEAIAYGSARHGIDADVGMAREGLASLCQAAIDFVESLPKDAPSRGSSNGHHQIGNGVQ
jgi:hypothetical protein